MLQDFAGGMVFVFADLPRGKPLLQDIERGIAAPALAWDVVGDGKYPKQQDDPDEPPKEVHASIITFVKHSFKFFEQEISLRMWADHSFLPQIKADNPPTNKMTPAIGGHWTVWFFFWLISIGPRSTTFSVVA
jgi:hypothetical protein